MLERTSGTNANVLHFQAIGKVTGDDYEQILIPALENALKAHGKIRFVYELGPQFEGFTGRALWDDAKVGLHHWRGFERTAIITDIDWIKHGVRLFEFVMPGPVRVFPSAERESALSWISED